MILESVLLLTKTRGALVDAGAHRARDMESWEEAGREKRRSVEEEKLLAESARGVSREREGRVVWQRMRLRENKQTTAQSILAWRSPRPSRVLAFG